ncbi:hypothetical protein [Nonomuraea lactucae]|uniref:hypothetical protein n=1 Tax=Nonomuraea lactucae TaxID=2249762 RepID=UPI000DE56002|nr:hypothetical protein [Nonomuraea lactucae]
MRQDLDGPYLRSGQVAEQAGVLIVIPLALAWLTQAWAARRPVGRAAAGAITRGLGKEQEERFVGGGAVVNDRP